MSYRLLAGFSMIWALMSMLGFISEKSLTDSSLAFDNLTNTINVPTTITINEPIVEEDKNFIESTADTVGSWFGSVGKTIAQPFEFAKQGTGWLKNMVQVATLDFDYLNQGWLQFLRYFMLALSTPIVFMAVREASQMLGQVMGGIGGVFRI